MPAATRLPRILVVEDEAIVARDIAQQLQSLGYAPVGIATTAQEALTMVEAHSPDLVLMDIQLPDINGVEAFRRIRAEPATAPRRCCARWNSPVIASTTSPMPTSTTSAWAA